MTAYNMTINMKKKRSLAIMPTVNILEMIIMKRIGLVRSLMLANKPMFLFHRDFTDYHLIRNMTPILVVTSFCPDIIGVGLASADASDCFANGIGLGGGG